MISIFKNDLKMMKINFSFTFHRCLRKKINFGRILMQKIYLLYKILQFNIDMNCGFIFFALLQNYFIVKENSIFL